MSQGGDIAIEMAGGVATLRLRNPARRARYDAQRRTAQNPAEPRATGVAVPVRVRARRSPPARDWLIRVGPVRSEPPRSQ